MNTNSKNTKSTEMAKTAEFASEATKTATNATKAFTGLFSALTESTRKTVEGVIEVDKALLGYVKDAATGYYELGRESFKAKDINDLIDLHAGHAHARIEATAANAREVVDLSRMKAKEAYAPVKLAFREVYPVKAA